MKIVSKKQVGKLFATSLAREDEVMGFPELVRLSLLLKKKPILFLRA